MKNLVEIFKLQHPQFSTFDEAINSTVAHNYSISDYAGFITKEGEGTFTNFVIALMNFANAHSVRSIKQIFDDKSFVNELDESGSTLYILATANYNGQKYTVKANSANKYITDNYLVVIEND